MPCGLSTLQQEQLWKEAHNRMSLPFDISDTYVNAKGSTLCNSVGFSLFSDLLILLLS